MIRLVTLYFTWLLYIKIFAILPPPNNAKALALGGASVTHQNVFSIENNVSVLAFIDNTLAINGQNRFGISDYSQLNVYGNLKMVNTVLGLGYSNLPFANLNIHKYQFAIAKKLHQDLSIGIGINYHRISSESAYYSKGQAFTVNLGLYYVINKNLNIGFHVFNPNRTIIVKIPEEHLEALYRLGIDYLVAPNVKIFSDVVQISSQNLAFHGGVEIEQNQYHLRGGFNTNQELCFGLGYNINQFDLDIGTSYHNVLGISPSLNICYVF